MSIPGLLVGEFGDFTRLQRQSKAATYPFCQRTLTFACEKRKRRWRERERGREGEREREREGEG
jgi:hypothetical protein